MQGRVAGVGLYPKSNASLRLVQLTFLHQAFYFGQGLAGEGFGVRGSAKRQQQRECQGRYDSEWGEWGRPGA